MEWEVWAEWITKSNSITLSKKILLTTFLVLVIFFSSLYIANSVKGFDWSKPQTESQLLLSELPAKTKIFETVKSEIETDITVTGEIEVVQFDDFENHENSHLEYFLRTGSERIPLRLSEDLFVVSGGTFRVTGKKIGDSIVANIKDVKNLADSGGSGASGGSQDGPGNIDGPGVGSSRQPESVGEQKTLVLLIKFNNSTSPQPISAQEMRSRIFNGAFQEFYKEQSYKKTYFSGDVLGWYDAQGSCDSSYQNVLGQAPAIISNNNINLTGYNRLLLVPQSCNGMSTSGWGTIGKITLNVNGVPYRVSIANTAISASALSGTIGGGNPPYISTFESIIIHEMGHNLGLFHAKGLDCGEVSYSTNCSMIEYGNDFDTMGGGFSSRHFNAYYKDKLGWMPAQNTISITQSGRYTIHPLETRDQNQNNFAKIKIPGSSDAYYLEFRRGLGFDGWLNGQNIASNQAGLFINRIISDTSFLMDMRPTTDPWYLDFEKVTLNAGSQFTDTNARVTIGPVIEANKNSVTFDVNIEQPVCVRENPYLFNVGNPVTVGIGGSYNINIAFRNQDSVACTGSGFNVIENGIPSSWLPTITPSGNIFLQPGFNGQKNINISVPTSTPLGMYPASYTVINSTTSNESTGQINFRVVESPQIESIEPASGSVGTNVTLLGYYFSLTPTVVMVGTNTSFGTSVPSNGTILNFQIPPFITNHICNCQVATPPGSYTLYVGTNNGVFSNPVTFEVR